MASSPAASLAGLSAITGIVLGLISIIGTQTARKTADWASGLRPARATLRQTHVVHDKATPAPYWTAYGRFDVACGDYRGVATSGLQTLANARAMREKYGAGSRHRTTREEAEERLRDWKVGATYEAFWHPEEPESVHFWKPDMDAELRTNGRMKIVAGVLFSAGVAGILLPLLRLLPDRPFNPIPGRRRGRKPRAG